MSNGIYAHSQFMAAVKDSVERVIPSPINEFGGKEISTFKTIYNNFLVTEQFSCTIDFNIFEHPSGIKCFIQKVCVDTGIGIYSFIFVDSSSTMPKIFTVYIMLSSRVYIDTSMIQENPFSFEFLEVNITLKETRATVIEWVLNIIEKISGKDDFYYRVSDAKSDFVNTLVYEN